MRIILLSFLAVLISHSLGNRNFLNFYSIWEYDSLVHLLGGVFAGSMGLSLARFLKNKKKYYFYSLSFAFIIGGLWEVYQHYLLHIQSYDPDTIIDLLMGLFGGWLIAFYYLRK